MGLIYALAVKAVKFTFIFFFIILLPHFPPKTTFDYSSFSITRPTDLTGPLEFNNLLDKSERLLENRVKGPENLLARGNDIYTDSSTGEVIRINGDHITHIARFGEPCEYFESSKCGRPLGMAFDTIGNNLIVADAYYGIWQVEITTGKKTLLVSKDTVLDGVIKRQAKIFNSVAVHSSGDIYWTDSSSDFSLDNGVYSMMSNPCGRLFHYSRAKNESRVLIDQISFANGLVLSPNEEFLVISETGKNLLRKYYLTGDKAGTEEIFVDGLPGSPDNLTPDEHGIWVPLVLAISSEEPSILNSLATVPLVRKFLLRIFYLMEVPFRLTNQFMPNIYSKKVLHYMGNFEVALPILPRRSSIIRVDWNGNYIASLYAMDRSPGYISHVLDHNGYLYLGSPFNSFLARQKMPQDIKQQVYAESLKFKSSAKPTAVPKVKPVEAPKPKPTDAPKPKPTEAPKPKTTETPKPKPTEAPKPKPTEAPKPKPTEAPKPKPTEAPTPKSTEVPKPTVAPKTKPTETPKPLKPAEPAPIHEKVQDTQKPVDPKLKVIKRGGEHGEL